MKKPSYGQIVHPNKKNKINKIFLGFFLGILIIFSGCSVSNENKIDSFSETEKIVESYYTSLNEKNYEKMYFLISDGFKNIDPFAKNLKTFENYMDNFFKTSNGIEILNIKEISNNGKKSTIDYQINIISKTGEKILFESSYSLKKQKNGWKLIHPYGKNIDTSE